MTSRTRRTPRLASSLRSGFVRSPSLHPRALVLGGEDPAHDLAGLDEPSAPQNCRSRRKREEVSALGNGRRSRPRCGRSGPSSGPCWPRAGPPSPAWAHASIALGRHLVGLGGRGHRRDLALGPAQQRARRAAGWGCRWRRSRSGAAGSRGQHGRACARQSSAGAPPAPRPWSRTPRRRRSASKRSFDRRGGPRFSKATLRTPVLLLEGAQLLEGPVAHEAGAVGRAPSPRCRGR